MNPLSRLLASCVTIAAVCGSAGAMQQASPPWTCNSPDFKQLGGVLEFGVQGDCSMNSNTAGTEYAPSYIMEVPVVWHVIHKTNGVGDVSDQRIIQQMAHMNTAFAGNLSGAANESGIRFVLASADPGGSPTTGIERIANDTWFNDSGNYTSLTWDSNRYLNIYTMGIPFGAIGYVPNLPQGGIVGTANDGVRMLHSAIDSNTYRHVVSHEIGHHFGLFHTFQGCTNNNCQTQGDLICDTNPHNQPTQSCGSNFGNCSGQAVPGNNFMNYQDITCVWEFTRGQIRRMRCTLENWRPDIWSAQALATVYCTAGTSANGCQALISAEGTPSATAASGFTLNTTGIEGLKDGLYIFGANGQQANAWGNGTSFQCVAPPLKRSSLLAGTGTDGGCDGAFSQDLNTRWQAKPNQNPGAGAVVQAQAWYRDPGNTSNQTTSLSTAIQFTVAP